MEHARDCEASTIVVRVTAAQQTPTHKTPAHNFSPLLLIHPHLCRTSSKVSVQRAPSNQSPPPFSLTPLESIFQWFNWNFLLVFHKLIRRSPGQTYPPLYPSKILARVLPLRNILNSPPMSEMAYGTLGGIPATGAESMQWEPLNSVGKSYTPPQTPGTFTTLRLLCTNS